MKARVLNFLLLATSQCAYLEWGGKQHLFLFQAELMLFSKLMHDPLAILHPMIVLPFIGQVLLLITLFQKKPNKLYTILSLIFLGVLNVFIFVIAILSMHFKMILCSVPFIVVLIMVIINLIASKRAAGIDKGH